MKINPKISAFLNRFRAPVSGTLQDRVVVLDNLTFRNVKLLRCSLLYGGGSIIANGLHVESCTWTYFGAAANTLMLMTALDKNGASDTIANTFPGAILHDRISGGANHDSG